MGNHSGVPLLFPDYQLIRFATATNSEKEAEESLGTEIILGRWFILYIVGSMETPSKVFLLFFLLPDWLKLNHFKSRMECGFSDIFSRHFCSTVAETIGVTNYAAGFGAKKC